MINTVYKITNIVNSKIYVGQTWGLLKTRWNKHRQPNYKRCINLHNAIKKYGIENFKIEPLTVTHSQETADYWETYFIIKYDTIVNGYNLKMGGSRGVLSEESKNKTSQSLMGHSVSEETRAKISKSKKGKKASEATRQKMSAHLMGNTRCVGRKPWNKGLPTSEESKSKQSKIMKGKPSPMKGRKLQIIDGKKVWIKI